MHSLRENEEFWRDDQNAIQDAAPDGAVLVVISDRAVKQYCTNTAEAVGVWHGLDGAIIKNLQPQKPPLITGNYLRHSELS